MVFLSVTILNGVLALFAIQQALRVYSRAVLPRLIILALRACSYVSYHAT
jgi:hypothetical protein